MKAANIFLSTLWLSEHILIFDKNARKIFVSFSRHDFLFNEEYKWNYDEIFCLLYVGIKYETKNFILFMVVVLKRLRERKEEKKC